MQLLADWVYVVLHNLGLHELLIVLQTSSLAGVTREFSAVIDVTLLFCLPLLQPRLVQHNRALRMLAASCSQNQSG